MNTRAVTFSTEPGNSGRNCSELLNLEVVPSNRSLTERTEGAVNLEDSFPVMQADGNTSSTSLLQHINSPLNAVH